MSKYFFIIENIDNINYIESLIMALFFFKDTHIEELLDKDIENMIGIYLQEYIKEHFINTARDGKSILRTTIENLNILCKYLGWSGDSTVNEFYQFLIDILEYPKIEMINTNGLANEFANPKIQIPYITLTPKEPECLISTMVHDWLEHKHMLPNDILPIYIQRTEQISNINIQKKIVINKYQPNIIEWYFHSVICNKNGHYYTLLKSSDRYYIFDNIKIPCLKMIRMDNTDIKRSIMRECEFMIYVRNKS